MKSSSGKSMLTGLSGVSLCLLFSGVLAGQPGGEPQPGKHTVTGTGTDTTATKPRHEDVLDRAFSPLDKAVSDINRDINTDIDKGDDKKAPETDQ